MLFRHVLLALLVVAIWGVNFVVIQVALKEIPPLLLTFLRFFFAAFPAIFFLKRPEHTSWKLLLAYSLSMFVFDFACLFTGMYLGVSSGIASLTLQTQVFFTAILAVIVLKERMSISKIVGAGVAFAGIIVVGFHAGGDVTLIGLLLVECAALSWAIGNLVSKRIGHVAMLNLVVWGSVISLPFLLGFSLYFESHLWSLETLTHLSLTSIGSLFYLVYPVTLFGFAIWSYLLSRYPATLVAPFTLLVPIFGFCASAFLLHEALPLWKLLAAALIITGLIINLYADTLLRAFKRL